MEVTSIRIPSPAGSLLDWLTLVKLYRMSLNTSEPEPSQPLSPLKALQRPMRRPWLKKSSRALRLLEMNELNSVGLGREEKYSWNPKYPCIVLSEGSIPGSVYVKLCPKILWIFSVGVL